MLRIFFLIFISLLASNAFSALEYQQGKRCTEFLGELSDETVRYNFTRTGPRGSYNVVEVPTVSGNGRYVTVYTATGYSEINTETGYCKSSLKDPKKNRNQKLLEMFKKRESDEVTNLAKLRAAKMAEPMAIAEIDKLQTTLVDGMRGDCAADFPEIYAYLEKNNRLPKPVRTSVDPVPPVPAGMPGMNPYIPNEIGVPPR